MSNDEEVASWSPEDRRRFERSLLRVRTAARITELLDDLGLSRSELAGRLGHTKPWVTKALSGHQNLTLDSLTDMGWALGVRWEAKPAAAAVRCNTPAANDRQLPEWVTQRNVYHVVKPAYEGLIRSGAGVVSNQNWSDYVSRFGQGIAPVFSDVVMATSGLVMGNEYWPTFDPSWVMQVSNVAMGAVLGSEYSVAPPVVVADTTRDEKTEVEEESPRLRLAS